MLKSCNDLWGWYWCILAGQGMYITLFSALCLVKVTFYLASLPYSYLQKTTILLQRSARRTLWPSLYLDAFGEEVIVIYFIALVLGQIRKSSV